MSTRPEPEPCCVPAPTAGNEGGNYAGNLERTEPEPASGTAFRNFWGKEVSLNHLR